MGTDRVSGDDGFEEAFDALFASARLIAVRLVGDGGEADDVAAEALARAYAWWSKVRDLDYRDAWVMRVTANVALDVLRRQRRPIPLPAASTVDPAEAAVTRLALAQALRRLPQRQRDVVVANSAISPTSVKPTLPSRSVARSAPADAWPSPASPRSPCSPSPHPPSPSARARRRTASPLRPSRTARATSALRW